MKLGPLDITETKPAGIDHRANTVFYAPDKHSIKCDKMGTKNPPKVIIFFEGWGWLLLYIHVTFIKCLLLSSGRSFFTLIHGQM